MENTELVQLLKRHSLQWLLPRVQTVLADGAAEVSRGQTDPALDTLLSVEGEAISGRFKKYFGYEFERLTSAESRKIEPGDYPDPSLVNQSFLEAVNAMEGMVNYARNTSIRSLINLNTRLDQLFPELTIDETNSPLDPERIAGAFVDALAPVRLPGEIRLSVYRCFNRTVLHEIDSMLEELNRLCIANGVLPELVVDGRTRQCQLNKRSSARPSSSPLERAFPEPLDRVEEAATGSSAYLFQLIVDLLHHPAGSARNRSRKFSCRNPSDEIVVPTAALTSRHFNGSLVGELGLLPLRASREMQVADRDVILVSSHQLINLLDRVQAQLVNELSDGSPVSVDYRQFTRLLGDALLESSTAGTLNAIAGGQFDRLLVIGLLYEAFCKDLGLVDPVKELVVATQLVFMKIAINEPNLFNLADHPARRLLNEVGFAGVGGVDGEDLYEDPVYVKFEALLIRLIMEYDGDHGLLIELCGELQDFREETVCQSHADPALIDPAETEREQRIAEIHAYVSSRIQERVSWPLHPVVETLVHEHYHRFLFQVAQRDGPGSNSWILVMKILDLLLWTVKPGKDPNDQSRFKRLNELLHPNLRKALLHSGLDDKHSNALLTQLKAIQEATFSDGHPTGRQRDEAASASGVGNRKYQAQLAETVQCASARPAPQSDSTAGADLAVIELPTVSAPQKSQRATQSASRHFLDQVDKLPIGCWLRFKMQGDEAISCTLAARLRDLQRLVFVNRQGVKVIEKSRVGLARELQQGSVRIISDWPLFERGMESVIARLRNRQQRH